jgi:hypothetical protein
MEKTPMQELIEYIEEWTPKNKVTDGIWHKAKSLLEKEETLIMISWIDGKENKYFGDNVFDDAQDYYNQKFKQ